MRTLSGTTSKAAEGSLFWPRGIRKTPWRVLRWYAIVLARSVSSVRRHREASGIGSAAQQNLRGVDLRRCIRR
jgi:hypothetical protein